ncbi:MAG: sigma 54-interacting transcriptional regulator [Deltaproteobacteria bacterium]|nr:sigma 54-interacting transcriptional regulator [Deltaproteobacteria bacterium]
MEQARTVGELRRAGYRSVSVREEMRRNLLAKLAAGEPILHGIVGYDDSVVPEIENAILAGHHIVFLGERGQGKSRIMRGLLALLDVEIPAVAGCEINDDPLAPICSACRQRAAAEGEALPIVWLPRDRRYGEKLATPDVSMADLIGEIDPIKVAEGRYLANEETIHYGLVPRTHRGIFAINELPDLTEKIQVGLFNVMEEKDVQIKGYKIRLPLDVVIIASANPEDYTSRGRIITPLKDRFDAQIRTHYPARIEDEIAILEQEVPARPRAGREVRVPGFIKELLAQITMEARESNEINQASGVSVRVTINNYESVIANAEKRAVRCGEREIVPRLTDLHAVLSSTAGKIELEYAGEEKKASDLIDRLTHRAVLKVFDRFLSVEGLKQVVDYFEGGGGVEVSDRLPAADYLDGIRGIPGLREAITALGPFESPALMAAASELILEGLHVHRKLNKERAGGRTVYKS